MMTQVSLILLSGVLVFLTACQQTKMSQEQPKPANTSFAPAPAAPLGQPPAGPGPGQPLPPDTTLPRYPEVEPRETVPVIPVVPVNPPPPPPPRYGETEPIDPPRRPPTPTQVQPPPTTWIPTNEITPTPPIVPPATSNPPPPPVTAQPPPPARVTPPPTPTTPPPPVSAPVPRGLQPVTPPPAVVQPPPPAHKPLAQPLPHPVSRPAVKPPADQPLETCGSENQGCRPVPIAPVKGQCLSGKAKIAETQTIKQLDILFVVDTSASLVKGPKGSREGGELVQIASQMESFVNQLDPATDIRIAVLLGHGPQSAHFGKLFSAGNGDPIVLDSRRMSKAQMREVLKNKMRQVPNESGGAQGEALMMNIYQALNSYKKIQEQGFFRPKTNLAIVTVSDEQDVCWNYPGMSYPTSGPMTVDAQAFAEGRVPVLKPSGEGKKKFLTPDPIEMSFYQNFCSTFVGGHMSKKRDRFEGGQPLSYQHLADAFKAYQETPALGGKVILNGIMYVSNQGLSPVATNEDENEVGHGIKELMDYLGQKPTDMSSVNRNASVMDFTKQLAAIGVNTRRSMKTDVVFVCDTSESGHHPESINPNKLDVVFTDKGGHSVYHLSAQCPTGQPCQHGNGGLNYQIESKRAGKQNYIYMRLTPKDQQAFLREMEERNVDEVDFRISYETKADYDTKSGKVAAGTPTALGVSAPEANPPPRAPRGTERF